MKLFFSILLICFFQNSFFAMDVTNEKKAKKLVYIVSDKRIPFWDIMSKGISFKAKELGYELSIYSSNNIVKKELEHLVLALKDNVDGIILSPTSSSSCVTLLKFAKKASIPVVISDIGTDSGEYVSYISSNNKQGGYSIGRVLAKKMHNEGYANGTVGIIAIPQKRANGKARTDGFIKALDSYGIKSADIKQQINFSYEETYKYTKELIDENNDLKAIFTQGSDRYQAVFDAIEDSGKKDKILYISFDAEPIFLDLINNDILVGSAMQQPYLMGEKAVDTMDQYLKGNKVKKNIQLEILAISKENIKSNMQIIKRNVLGIEDK